MTPATLNLSIRNGITFGPVIFNCKDAFSAPVDLTGYFVFADARKTYTDPVAFSLAPVISDPVNGEITMTFTDEQAESKPAGNYGWDLVLEAPTGERLGPYVTGRVNVTDVYTQP